MAIDVLVVEPAREVDDNPGQPGRRRWLWLVVIVAFALFATVLTIICSNEVHTDTQFDQTHRSLDETQTHTRTVLSNLSRVRHELAGVNVQVFLTNKALTQDAADLQSAQAELVNARSDVTHQTTVITDLQTCLGGVQEALNALSVADQSRAIDALNSVSSSCNSAVATNG